MTLPAGLKDWRTTLLGIAQAVNAGIMAVQAIQAQNEGVVFIEPKLWARFLLIGALLKIVGGILTPSTAKVIEKTHEIVDAKLEQRETQ
jgi:hypothetical protein